MGAGKSRRANEQNTRHSTVQREHSAHHHASEASHSRVPLPASLLGDARLAGRGNGPVQIALMRDMQGTHGNRAMQRLLQRAAVSAAPAAPPQLSMQRQSSDAGKGAQRGPVAIQRDDKAPKPPTYSGTVFLPGQEHAGHVYTVKGDKIVEKKDKEFVTKATIDAEGNYFLVDAAGKPAAAPNGKLADLVGAVSSQVGKKVTNITRTTGTGEFRFPDKKGTERVVTVKDGGVYTGTGKTQQLVGSVDAKGNYQLTLDGEFYKGSLTALPPGKVTVKLTETEGKTGVQELQIGTEKIEAGTIYFDDGKYTVKAGKLYRDGVKDAVGDIAVVKEKGSGEKKVTLKSILYKYTDATGKEQSGDLISGKFATKQHALGGATVAAGEGTALKMGKRKWTAFVDKKWEELTQTKKGFVMSGGGQLKTKLQALKKAGKITLTDTEIKHLQAVAEVESSGLLQVINTWDSDGLSFGFIQYTMAGKLQALIKEVPAAFKKYGIEVEGDLVLKSKGNMKVEGIKGIANEAELRSAHWSAKFYQAGFDDEIIIAQVGKAKKEIDTVVGKVSKYSSTSPFFDLPYVQGAVLELNNNRPAYVAPVLKRTAERAKANPKLTEAEFVKILGEEMESEYVTNNKKGFNGKTDDDARKKARNILSKTRTVYD